MIRVVQPASIVLEPDALAIRINDWGRTFAIFINDNRRFLAAALSEQVEISVHEPGTTLQKNFIARFQLQLIYFLKAVKWCILALSIVPVLSVESTDIISCPLRARCRFCCFCTRAWDY